MKRLQKDLVPLQVFPQVSMNAVLDIKNQRSWKDRVHFWAKIIDYVVCIPETFEIIAIIEFDGPSHDNPETMTKDRERDAMMESAGYIVIRYNWDDMPSPGKLKADFKRILARYHIFKDIDQAEFARRIEHLDEF
jgi:very-short-patch-repair endonuclease